MTPRVSAIARYTVLEALRTRLPLATAIAVMIVLAFSYFVREIALIQDVRMQTTVYAAVVRVAAVFIVALHVAASLGRDFADKGLDAVLALDIPRWQYIAGKYAGYACAAAIVCVIASLPLFVLTAHAPALAWLLSLMLETWMIAALAMFCVVTFSHLPSAMSFVAGFYLLCRAISGLQLVAAHPLAGAHTPAHETIATVLSALALLVPPLDTWTRTAWLVSAAPTTSALGIILLEAAIYSVLLLSATLVDFYRKSL